MLESKYSKNTEIPTGKPSTSGRPKPKSPALKVARSDEEEENLDENNSEYLKKLAEYERKKRNRDALAMVSAGIGSPPGTEAGNFREPRKPKPPRAPKARRKRKPNREPKEPPKPENSSTDLKTQLMYILADKLDEVNKPRLNVPDPTDRPKPVPVPTKPVKPPKPLAKYYRPKPKKPPVTEWTERIIKILVEMKRPAHLQVDKYKISGAAKLQGLPQINKLRASRGLRPHPRSPLANDPRIMQKSTALGSVFNSQPLGPTEKAKVEADKAKEAADRPRVEAELAKFDRDPVVARIRRNNRRWSR